MRSTTTATWRRRAATARRRALRAALAAAAILLPSLSLAAAAPPRISIAAPGPGAALSGSVVLRARAASPAGIAGVQFRLDGADLGPRLTAAPYAFAWDTSREAGDTHLLTAAAWDESGSSATSAVVSVVVDNTPLQLGEVSAAAAADGDATIAWTTNQPADSLVEYGPSPAYGASTVLDGALKLAHRAVLSGLTPGTAYHYRVKSRGASGTTAESGDLAFATPAPAADTIPPAAVIMNPASGALVAGTVAVSANATDNVGVAAVQFILDGAELGAPVTAAPFLFSWNTAYVPDGAHTLAALARDAAGNSATAVVSVMVSNAPPVIGPPSVSALAPDRADVLWTTDQRADSSADYGPTTDYGSSAPTLAAQSTGHGVTLTGLSPGTLYHCRVKSRSASGVLSTSDDFTFTTPGGPAAGAASAAAAAPADATAKAPQRFLTPASADGIGDKAVFGPQAQEVRIFDLRGRQVFRANSLAAGSPVVWTCRDATGRVVPSGVYLAKIMTRDSRRVYQSFAVAK